MITKFALILGIALSISAYAVDEDPGYILTENCLSFPQKLKHGPINGQISGEPAKKLGVQDFARIFASHPDIEGIDFSTYEHKVELTSEIFNLIPTLKNLKSLNLIGCRLLTSKDVETIAQISGLQILK